MASGGVIAIIIIIILLLIGFGIWLFIYLKNKNKPAPTPSPTPPLTYRPPLTLIPPTLTPIPTPAPTISPTISIPPGIYAIMNVNWGLYLTGKEDFSVKTYTTAVREWEQWKIEPTLTYGLYTIYSVDHNTYLVGNSDNTVTQYLSCDIPANGFWYITQGYDGSVLIQNSMFDGFLSGRGEDYNAELVNFADIWEEWKLDGIPS